MTNNYCCWKRHKCKQLPFHGNLVCNAVYVLVFACLLASAHASRAASRYDRSVTLSFDQANTTTSSNDFSFHSFFPLMNKTDFFQSIYQIDTFIHNFSDPQDPQHKASRGKSATEMGGTGLTNKLSSLADFKMLCHAFKNEPEPRSGFLMLKKEGETTQVTSCTQMLDELQRGAGLLIRFEDFPQTPVQPLVSMLHRSITKTFGTKSTVHVYLATQPDSRALLPHTDPYDVLVLQLSGSKQWTTCVPGQDSSTVEQKIGNGAKGHDNVSGALSPAQLGQLQEIRRQKQRGCTAYGDHNLAGMTCRNFTLVAGDTMYLPKGMIHFARTGTHGSAHVTISLERQGLTWADGLVFAASKLQLSTSIESPFFSQRWKRALLEIISDDLGIVFLEAMPSWAIGDSETTICDDFEGKNTKDIPTDANSTKASSEQITEMNNMSIHHFRSRYVSLCQLVLPFFQKVSIDAGDIDAMANSASTQFLSSSICSHAAADGVRQQLCSHGRLPSDVTSATFRRQVESFALAAPDTEAQLVQRQRRATLGIGYECAKGCDAACDSISCTGSCDDSCDDSCTTSCNECDEGCTGSCDLSCDDGCDVVACVEGCDESCDKCYDGCDDDCNLSCDESCDDNCSGPCTDGCDDLCQSSCDDNCIDECLNNDPLGSPIHFICKRLAEPCSSSCDENCLAGCDDNCACTTGCDTACDYCSTGCDDNCVGECDDSCDDICKPGLCDDSCDESCDDKCLTSCDGPCDDGCTTGCDENCDDCVKTSCDEDCDDGCRCIPGFFGTGQLCKPCPPGSYSTSYDSPGCELCQLCPTGFFLSGCGKASPGKCQACASCPIGHFRFECTDDNPGYCTQCLPG